MDIRNAKNKYLVDTNLISEQEDGNGKSTNALELEVFQIIFN